MRGTKAERHQARLDEQHQKLQRERFARGVSDAAEKRRRNRQDCVRLHSTHKPGVVIEMSHGARYVVAEDGSYRTAA